VTPRSAPGTVTLVGAGPGDPALLTLRGLAALRTAEVVVYDRLVSTELLDYAPESAERVFVGKAPRKHTHTQAEINRLLVSRARRGKSIVRLKGGDPFVFGRGGEEALALAAAGIPFEVVPGVTSATAGPAAAGIPVTHRGVASTFGVATAHEAPGSDRLDWAALARLDTLVVLMGVERLGDVAAALIAAGKPRTTPVAVVSNATLPRQRTVVAPLSRIAAAARRAGIAPPAVTIVGDVVKMREALGGWDTRPLSGRRIVVTRTREQASELAAVLRELGAEVIEAPSIRVAQPRSWAPVDRAAKRLADTDWVVFTSANGVRFFCSRLRDARAFGRAKVAAIGPGTANALAAFGVRADLVPERFTTSSVAALFPHGAGRVLLARADKAEPELEKAIRSRGWTVERVTAYRLGSVAKLEPAVAKAVRNGAVDVLTFASAATVRAFVKMLGGLPPRGVKVACIGPVTAAEARRLGLRVHAVAREHTIPGLAAATVTAVQGRRSARSSKTGH
jgi:uroporphyrinogen III methyltransferase / synthase